MAIALEVFYDYRCPYVYRADRLLSQVAEAGRDLRVTWRPFSLAQVNARQVDGEERWTIWGGPDGDHDVRGRASFAAAEAARRQGRFEPFHSALLAQRFEHNLHVDDPAGLAAAALAAGLDLEAFDRDRAQPGALDRLRTDHLEAEAMGIFGTPTVRTAQGSAYVRLARVPEPGRPSLDVLDRMLATIADDHLLEIKRPRN